MNILRRSNNTPFSNWWWTIDRVMILQVMLIIGLGMFIMTSAGFFVAERIGLHGFFFVKRQILYMTLAFVMMLAISFMNIDLFFTFAVYGFVCAFIMMVAVPVFGDEIKGAKRWLRIFGVSLQPSELFKVFFAVINAYCLAYALKNNRVIWCLVSFGLYALGMFLLFLQPDVGTIVVLSCVWFSQIFIYGIPMYMISIVVCVLGMGCVGTYLLFEHVRNRIHNFLVPVNQYTNYQVHKSLEAFHNGGFFGMGPGEGRAKMHLPDAHTDFIFAVAGEEMGGVFAVFLFTLLMSISLRFIVRITEEANNFIVIAGIGLIMQWSLQIMINVGVNIRLLPAKGMALPLISYGGSSLLATGILLGMLMVLSRKRFDFNL